MSVIPKNRKILIIDDNESIHQDFQEILSSSSQQKKLLDLEAKLFDDASPTKTNDQREKIKFQVDSAYQGKEGIDKVASALAENSPYALAFVDIRMPPGIDGVETVKQLWSIAPDLQIILCTAYSDYSWEEMNQSFGPTEQLVILKKPFESVEVRQLASALTEKWNFSKQIQQKIEQLEKEIKERQKVELALQESEKKYRTLFENNPVSIWEEDLSEINNYFQQLRAEGVTDLDDYFKNRPEALAYCVQLVKILDINQATLQLHHAKNKAELLENLNKVFTTETYHVFQKEMVDFWTGKNQIHSETTLQTVDGQICHAIIGGTVVPGHETDLSRVLISVSDITDRVRFEEVMVQSEKMMTIGGLAAGMAHEINNPLSIILQSLQNITRFLSPDFKHNQKAAEEAGIDLDALQHYLKLRKIPVLIQGIQEAAERAARIINDMLQFSRPNQTGKSPVEMAELINKTVELASSDYDLKKQYDFRDIEIIREFEPNLPMVCCAPGEIQQVLLNLFRNAAQAMHVQNEESTRKDLTLILRLQKNGEMARIEIEDSGMGMDTVTKKRVFEPFFTTKEVGIGTGLGLSISYFIVTTNHKGQIMVDSRPGKGTTFTILLPFEHQE